jgi:hypothetical protein
MLFRLLLTFFTVHPTTWYTPWRNQLPRSHCLAAREPMCSGLHCMITHHLFHWGRLLACSASGCGERWCWWCSSVQTLVLQQQGTHTDNSCMGFTYVEFSSSRVCGKGIHLSICARFACHLSSFDPTWSGDGLWRRFLHIMSVAQQRTAGGWVAGRLRHLRV